MYCVWSEDECGWKNLSQNRIPGSSKDSNTSFQECSPSLNKGACRTPFLIWVSRSSQPTNSVLLHFVHPTVSILSPSPLANHKLFLRAITRTELHPLLLYHGLKPDLTWKNPVNSTDLYLVSALARVIMGSTAELGIGMAVPSNVAELLVVRHGETSWNALGRLQVRPEHCVAQIECRP